MFSLLLLVLMVRQGHEAQDKQVEIEKRMANVAHSFESIKGYKETVDRKRYMLPSSFSPMITSPASI